MGVAREFLCHYEFVAKLDSFLFCLSLFGVFI
jgi:hypothetical protein